ncbi:hypothetical protein GJ496_001807 [Pomphorhynchus laevis]|nr:hypothetical protein GJ496_001807 [Pomphorhynchus laevis]
MLDISVHGIYNSQVLRRRLKIDTRDKIIFLAKSIEIDQTHVDAVIQSTANIFVESLKSSDDNSIENPDIRQSQPYNQFMSCYYDNCYFLILLKFLANVILGDEFMHMYKCQKM